MDPERSQRIEQLYHAALDREPGQRAAFLAQDCQGDHDLRREVEARLAHSDSSGELRRVLEQGVGSLLDETHLPAGAQLGPYRIEAPLGAGGMGVVYRARDTKLNRPVAIKLLSQELADAAARRRFQRESQTVSSLNHPHILTVHDAGEFKGRQYLVTEYVDGGTLRDWVRAEKRTWFQVVELLVGVADGLATAHAAGILHRDIKPANILVAKNGYAKLADFGLAKLADPPAPKSNDATVTEAPTRPGMILGTIPYMSPEQAAGLPLDSRSDLFSFGVVLYEALAGRRPFSGETDLEVLQRIRHGTLEPLGEEIPIALRKSVEKALEKDPADRYSSMRDLLVDLKRAQWPNTGEAQQFQAPVRPGQRRWRMAISIAAAAVLAALVLGWRLRESDYFWQNPLAGARTERLTDFEGDEVDAAISPDGKFLVFLSDRDGQYEAWLSQIGSGEFANLTKGQFSTGATHRDAIRRVGFFGDGPQVWITQGQGSGPYMLWQASAMGSAPHPFRAGMMEPAWSPDGSQIVYHTADPGDPIHVADRTGSNPRQILIENPDIHCHHLTWSPDGRFIYFVKGTPTTQEMDIWRIPAAASGAPSKPERITNHKARVAYLAWLDDRTLIYSASAEDHSGQWLYTLDVEHRRPRRASSGITEQYLSVAASATRPRRLVVSVATPVATLWTVPLSDRTQTEAALSRFPIPNTRARGPRFGSGYLLFLSSRGGGDGLWKLENGVARELWKGSEGGLAAPPAISTDGSQICFSYRKQGRAGLYIMDSGGVSMRALAQNLDVRGAASWSPDGKWVAVAANTAEGSRVFKVPVDGGPPVRLLDTTSYHPLWSPDGGFILYAEPTAVRLKSSFSV